jgi:diguanylate cyclase (GGDEF)-like protein
LIRSQYFIYKKNAEELGWQGLTPLLPVAGKDLDVPEKGMVLMEDHIINTREEMENLKIEVEALKSKLLQAETQNLKQQEIQQRLGEINNNYLMLHYLNKNILDCRSSQSLWQTYLQNIGERGFNYSNVMVLLPDEKGEFSNMMYLQDGKVVRKAVEGEIAEPHIAKAIETKEVQSSIDNLRVAVPMVNHCGTPLAVLCAEKRGGIFFEDIQLLEVYVQQTVATIENINLNEKLFYYQELLGKRMDQFVMLHYIAQEINAAADYYDLLKRYLKAICSPMGFNLKNAVMYVLDDERIQKASLVNNQLVLEFIDTMDCELAVRALEQKATIMEYDRELALPLNFSGKISAIIDIQNEEGIKPDQVQILETFAVQTSAKLENTRLNTNLEFLSFHDPLTALYNRFFCENEMKRIESKEEFPAGVIICDVDGLKLVNDNLGHSAGDELIREAARMIQAAAQEHVVSRIGGDEFTVLLSYSDKMQVHEVVEQIKRSMERYNKGDRQVPVWISVGCATSDKLALMADLLKEADRRMYEDKLKNGPAHREDIGMFIRNVRNFEKGQELISMNIAQI